MAAPLGLLAALPPGASTPSSGVVFFALLFLLAVLGLNAVWEIVKGPPNP